MSLGRKIYTDQRVRNMKNIWMTMKGRCENINSPSYHRYGGRGIKVCARWASFDLFLSDLGFKPDGLTLERIDNDGDYEPNNCRWASMMDQAYNKCNTVTYEYKGVNYNKRQVEEIFKVPRNLFYSRIFAGWSVKSAIETPILNNKNYLKNRKAS